MRTQLLALAAPFLVVSHSALAANLFNITGTVNSAGGHETRSYGYNRADDALNSLRTHDLASQFSSYSGHEVVLLNMDFRGLGMNVGYYHPITDPHGTTLTLEIPSLGIQQSFSGHTRDESQQMYSDFMKKNGGSILDQIYKKLAEVSPTDPIAGNPNSLMGRMVSNDFATAFNDVGTNIGPGQEGKRDGLVGVGLQVSSLRQNGLSNNSFTLPFSYTIRNDIDPRRQLIFNIPVNYSSVEGANGYGVGFGVAYRVPMNDNWTLTPALNYGLAVATDQGASGHAVSGSLASTYVFRLGSRDLVVGNMLGYYRTLRAKIGDYSYNPGIANPVLRNGVMLSQPVTVMGKKMSLEYSLIDTKFFGTKLYNMHYNEIGATLGTNKKASSARTFLRAGASYLFAPNTKGVMLNLGYWF